MSRVGIVVTALSMVVGLAPAAVSIPPATASDARLAAPSSEPGARASALGRSCLKGKARCGRVRLPLDPSRPAGPRVGIAYEFFPHTQRRQPSRGTIVAVEGGPGYSTTGSRAYYRDLFAPLLDRRDLLLVDNRGTGKSEPIRCKRLQSYRGNRVTAIGRCGHQLGTRSDLYGTAPAVDDLAAVLDHLGIDRVDLYGDSYGTFFSQAFAVAHPDRLRTLILDAAYFVGGRDPWYSDTNRAMRSAFNAACRRSTPCAQRSGEGMARIRRLVQLVRRDPIAGKAPNADGRIRRIRVGTGRLIDILTAAATTPTIYRELDAAARAALRDRPYNLPLLRLAREVFYAGGAGAPRWFSEGLYVAVSCNDYPQPFDLRAGRDLRRRQFDRAVGALRRQQPRLFGPFSVREWVRSSYGYYDDCLRWPAPGRWRHPVPAGTDYPDVPTLVLAGDLDSLTSPEGARATARAFPRSTYVEVANMVHVSALVDFDTCASRLVRRFVVQRRAGNTSCAGDYHENRLVDRFVSTAAGTRWGNLPRRTARVAAATAADVMARWLSMYGSSGVGLHGGHFTTHGGRFTAARPVVRWRLDHVRWVSDVAVSGQMLWHRRSGWVSADLAVRGAGAAPGRVRLRWQDSASRPRAIARGTLGGRPVQFEFPAP